MIFCVRRDIFRPTTTLGALRVVYDGPLAYAANGWRTTNPKGPLDFSYSLEDEDRGLSQTMTLAQALALKVAKETAVGVGEYIARVRFSPGHQRRVLELVGTVGHRYVQLHSGNHEGHTDACILPGFTRDVKALTIGSSRKAEDWITARAEECQSRGETIRVRIERDEAAWALAPFNPKNLPGGLNATD